MIQGRRDLSKTSSGLETRRYPREDKRILTRPPASPYLASGLGGVVSSRGLVLSITIKNTFVSEDLGVVLPLNGNLDEPLYMGQIR